MSLGLKSLDLNFGDLKPRTYDSRTSYSFDLGFEFYHRNRGGSASTRCKTRNSQSTAELLMQIHQNLKHNRAAALIHFLVFESLD